MIERKQRNFLTIALFSFQLHFCLTAHEKYVSDNRLKLRLGVEIKDIES